MFKINIYETQLIYIYLITNNIISEQLQFLKHSNQIYVMHKGRIVEQGTHDELIKLNREYAAMVNSALLKTKNSSTEYAFYK